jgi:PAS domain S-box-containing protein
MQTAYSSSTEPKADMAQLPAFAQYLLNHHLHAFQQALLQYYTDLQVPLLRHLPSPTEIELLVNQGTHDLLKALANNTISAHIRNNVQAFFANKIPHLERSQLVVDDITLVAHARKSALLDFLPGFTSDPYHIRDLVKEIDVFVFESTSLSFKAFVNLADERMSDQLRRLEESERQFKQAQAITHIGNFSWDLVHNQLSWSDELYQIYGLEPAVGAIPNHIIATFNHPDDAPIIKQYIDHSRATCEPFDFYYRIILKDGSIKTLHAQGEAIADHNGQAHTLFGTTQDVTERQNLIATLQQNEQLYRQMETIAHVGTWRWDVTENKVRWTDELFRIYGLEPQSEDLTYESYITFIHPEDREIIIQAVTQALTLSKPYTLYHRICLRDGTTKVLHSLGEVVTDSQGKVVQLMGSAQDVTQQKIAEDKLVENQNFIKKITDSTPAIISSYHVDTGQYTFINKGIKKVLNYEQQHIMERGLPFLLDLVHPDDLAGLIEHNNNALSTANQLRLDGVEEVFEYRYRIKHQNGTYRWLHTFGTIFERTRSHQVKQVLNISLDITGQIEAEQVLLQRTRELQQSNASLEEFAYITSHDLKEPLRKITLFVERLAKLRAGTYTEDEEQVYDKIFSSSVRMRHMIDDILSLSLISHKNTPEPTNLQKQLNDVLHSFEPQIIAKEAVIEADSLPTIPAIPAQINHLFQNLISNSLKFCRPGAHPRIIITYRYLSPAEAGSSVKPAKRYIKLKFSDNGIGFDNEFQEKIFAIFQRLHHKHQYEGTGIGLAICKKIVANHGGSITASGRVDEGAVFSIILPL